MAGQRTGYKFDGLLLEGGRKVFVAFQFLRPVSGHLPVGRVSHSLDKEHSGREVPQVMGNVPPLEP